MNFFREDPNFEKNESNWQQLAEDIIGSEPEEIIEEKPQQVEET